MDELLRTGLAIAVAGMALVFAGLGLLWGLIVILPRVIRAGAGAQSQAPEAVAAADTTVAGAEAAEAAALTAERARVAAIVAAALMANAVPLLFEAPIGPTFEHGRTAPAWVTTNRARAMRPWQPPHRGER